VITLTRNQVRRLRGVFRRSVLGINQRGPIPPLVFHAEGGQLRAHHRYRDLTVELVEPGSYRPTTRLAIPLDDLADCEGSKDTPVVLEAAAPDRTVVRWEDRAIPQSREYDVTPVERVGPVPELPASWATNPAGLLTALADATDTGIPDSTRYALHCVQLQGTRNQVVATDGRQLLVRAGFRFPWPGDLLIKGSPLFACRALPRDQPVEVGKTETHVVLRVGPWTIWLEIQKEVRFPDVERAIPQPGEVTTRLRVDPEDARFLESSLARLPGAEELNSPVIVDLNGKIAVRANPPDQPQQVTELVLNRSSYTGSPVCIATNRLLLDRALRLGFTEIGFSGVETPFVCRDQARVYAVQPLSGATSPSPEVSVIRIESNAATAAEDRVQPRPETPRRPMSEPVGHEGHEPARPAVTRSQTSVRSAESSGTSGTEPPGTSLAALIQEAEALHATLADAKSRTARLISGLRRHRKQSRLVNETLKSLRELRLQDVVA
jgi:hypothetical protein